MSTAVLLMAYGGPDSLDDVEPYLLDVRGGRPTAPELVAEIRARYAQIGGYSPLLKITRAQAVGLQTVLGDQAQVYVGMRHWTPYIRDVVQQIAADGHTRLIGLCMAPHSSRFSTGAYRARFEEAVKALAQPVATTFVESWHNQPQFIEALAGNIRTGLEQFTPEERAGVHYLFSAHSVPAAPDGQSDPYPLQLRETAELLAARLGLLAVQWSQCYQSVGRIPGAWLTPQIDAVLPELAAQGIRNVVVTAIGFVADHVEVLYDLDIEAQALAQKYGIHLVRSASVNAAPVFIEALSNIVKTTLSKEMLTYESIR